MLSEEESERLARIEKAVQQRMHDPDGPVAFLVAQYRRLDAENERLRAAQLRVKRVAREFGSGDPTERIGTVQNAMAIFAQMYLEALSSPAPAQETREEPCGVCGHIHDENGGHGMLGCPRPEETGGSK